MRELREILSRLRELERGNAPAALVTLVRVEGSSYRREGARLLVEPDGRLTGVLSGGCLERDIVALAAEAIAADAPRTQVYDLTADEEAIWGSGTGCAGRVTLLIEPLATPRRQAEIQLLETLLEQRSELRVATLYDTDSDSDRGEFAAHAGDRIILSIEGVADGAARRGRGTAVDEPTRLPPTSRIAPPAAEGGSQGTAGSTPQARAPARLPDRPAGAAPPGLSFYGSFFSTTPLPPMLRQLEALAGGEARASDLAVEGGAAALLVESLQPPIHLLLIGAERDVPALARLGVELGWAVTVADPRPGDAARARFPPEVIYAGVAPRALPSSGIELSGRTALLLATHRYLDDLAFLAEIGDAPVGWLGLLGPVRRRERILADLARLDPGLAARVRARISCPAGLDLGGRAPEEVALSVVAEIQAAFRGRSAGRLSAKAPEAGA